MPTWQRAALPEHMQRATGQAKEGVVPSGKSGSGLLVRGLQRAKKGGTMKKTKNTASLVFEADSPILEAGDMRPEYDFSQLQQVGERGRHAKEMRQGYTTVIHHKDGTREVTHYRPLPGTVHLAPDVQAYFPDGEAVNTALRGLIARIPARRRTTRKARQQAQEDTIP
jgi:hypothetical protein